MKLKNSKTSQPVKPATAAFSLKKGIEQILLVAFLVLAALRSTFIETPIQGTLNPMLPLPSEAISLVLSTIGLAIFILWLLIQLWSPPTQWTRTGMLIPLGAFIFLGLCSAGFASDKRAAISDLYTLSVLISSTIMLIQWFRNHRRLYPVLWVLIALGIASTFQCYQQREDNLALIENYEKNPQEVMGRLNIEPDTLKHWQFKHRLYSQDIRGFLTTSNSTGSFLLLCFFACFGLLVQTCGQQNPGKAAQIVLYTFLCAILAGGLWLTKSRGALAAGFIALGGTGICLFAGRYIWKYRFVLIIGGLIILAIAAGLIIHYGLTHDRLPGPNAMLVRWQYWVGAGRMIQDHPALGVGGANFTYWYPQYKIPAAPETVRDPHNFILRICSDYGILGGLAFLAVMFVPLFRLLKKASGPPDNTEQSALSISIGLCLCLLSAIMLALLTIRPIVFEGRINEFNIAARQAYYFVFYITPAAIWIIVFGLLTLVGREGPDLPKKQTVLSVCLLGGLIAILIHNCIDFAIFDTPVFTFFWVFIAALIGLNRTPSKSFKQKPVLQIGGTVLLLIVTLSIFFLAVKPPVQAGRWIQRSLRYPDRLDANLAIAQSADPLSPLPPHYRGLAARQQFDQKLIKDPEILLKAVNHFHKSAGKNPSHFQSWESLCDTYLMLAELHEQPDKTSFLHQAALMAKQAHHCYPGSDRIAFKLGLLYEQLEDPERAIPYFEKAVEIEQAYRKQFQIMYPEYDLFSRLGQERFEHAQDYIREYTQCHDKKTEQ